jgi:hypothetical protein
VAVGFAGLRAAGLAHVGARRRLPKGTSFLTSRPCLSAMRTIISKSGDAGFVGGLLDELQVAVAVGDGAGFLVEVGGGQDDVGEGGGLGEEDVLHDDEGVLERCGIDAVALPGWSRRRRARRARHVCGIEDLEHVEAGFAGGWHILRRRRRWSATRHVAGEQIGQQAHVGCAARVGVVAEVGELQRSAG